VNPVDSLPVIAEISLGLVGFTAVVAVLRKPDGGLGTANLFRSLHLLGYASATLLLSLFPFLLTAIGCEPEAMWRISSSAMSLTGVVGLIPSPRQRQAISLGKPRDALQLGESIATKSRFFALLGLLALNLVLQLANAVGLFGLPQFWPFLLGLLCFLIYCLAQFASLLFMEPSE
jgi:hypothetical protein